MTDFLIAFSKLKTIKGAGEIFKTSPKTLRAFNYGISELYLWGDPILPSNQLINEIAGWDVKKLLSAIKGHFYFLKFDLEANTLSAGVSLFNILPLYYCEKGSDVLLSSNPQHIASELPDASINKRFVLENILFNYQIFNQSCFNGIDLLPANHFLLIQANKVSIEKHTSIEDLFVPNPRPWRKSADMLSDLFIESSKYYFPDEPYATSLTGGFDGRTLVSCGLFYGKHFSTYSFGTIDSKDVEIARKLSKNNGLVFENIALDENYIQKESLANGLEFINGAYGGAGFARAHYLYAAKKLAKNYRFMVTGNFGSEVFRAAHIAGIVISPNLFNLLVAKDYDEAIALVSSSKEFDWLNKLNFKNEWEELQQDIKTLPCFDRNFKALTKNEQFYKIVYDEVLRKYFGAEMVNQYKYLINRTPFLDYEFVKSILETEMAGVYSDFFTHNPFKRFKGQVLYAHIIKKAYPKFSTEMTDKGYRPNDLLTFAGNVRIGISFVQKRVRKKTNSGQDPYAVDAAFKHNKSYWQEAVVDPAFFYTDRLKSSFQKPEYSNDSFYIALSQAWWLNHLRSSKK